MIMFTPAAQLPEAARSLRSPMPPRQTWHSKKTGSAWTRENFDEKNNFQCSVSFSVHSASFSKFCLSLAWLESNYPMHSPSWLLLWFIGCAQTAAYVWLCMHMFHLLWQKSAVSKGAVWPRLPVHIALTNHATHTTHATHATCTTCTNHACRISWTFLRRSAGYSARKARSCSSVWWFPIALAL